MDGILESLSGYISKGILVPGEQIITTTLLNFEKYVPEQIDDELFEKIENILLNVLNINKGTLSFQCSIRIATCLLALYQTSSPPKIWNLFLTVSKQPNPSNIFAIGFIIDEIGGSAKSMISGLAQKLVNSSNDLLFPSIYTIKQCFKRDRIDLESLSLKSFALAKKGINTKKEHIILASLSLLSTLIKQKDIPQKKFLAIANDLLKTTTSPFIIDRTCYLIAKLAYFPLIVIENMKEVEEKDFTVGQTNTQKSDPAKSLFNQAFGIMCEFKSRFSVILYHFLNLVDPQIICKYLPLLFTTIRKIQPSEISHLMELFGPDSRKELFESVSNENPPSTSQLKLLMALQSNKNSVNELSALAMQLASSKNTNDRVIGASFFSSLAEVQPEFAMRYLETSMLYLAFPPEGNPNLEYDIHGFSLIASNILKKIDDKNESANKVANHISSFLERALASDKFLSSTYFAAYTVMSSLPSYLIPSALVTESVKNFMKYINSIKLNNTFNEVKLKFVTNEITNFFVSHENHEMTPHFFLFIMNTPIIQSKQILISICSSAPHVMANTQQIYIIAQSLLTYIIKEQPNSSFLKQNIKNTMISTNEMVNSAIPDDFSINEKNYIENNNNHDLNVISDNNESVNAEFSLQILNHFPKLVNAIPQKNVSSYIKSILSIPNRNPQMVQALFLSLCSNEDSVKLLSDEFPSIIVNLIKDERDLVRLQVLSECLGKWTNSHSGFLADILQYAFNMNLTQKCLVYSSILGNVSIDNNVIIHIMNELDNIALNSPTYAIFALHGLSILFHTYSIRLAEMNVADIQLNVILSLLNTHEISLEPYSLNYIALCFINLLPVLSADARSLEPRIIERLTLSIQGFIQLKSLSFACQIMFRALRAVFVFAKEIATNLTNISFPSSKGATNILQITACGAFSDMLKIGISTTDYFDMVPKILILLQRTQNNLPAEFIQSIAADFANHEINNISENTPQKINDWVSIIKSILSTNALPIAGKQTIESNDYVKKCALIVSQRIIPLLAKVKPLLGECLDDIMTSITRTIETKSSNLMDAAYDLLYDVLINFEDFKVEGGQRLLELYDSQFFIAIRYAFQTNLSHSGNVLIRYIDYQLISIKSNYDDFKLIFKIYIDGLSSIKKSSAIYFTIATHICHIIQTHNYLSNLINDYKEQLIVQLCEVISISMALWRSDPEDWEQVSQFRINYSSSYSDILVSFIWLQSKLDNEILSFSTIYDFFIDELNHGTEYWRMAAAFSALTAIMQFSKNSIEPEKVAKAIEAAEHAKTVSPKLGIDILPSFIKSCTTIRSDDGKTALSWSQMLNFILTHDFDIESFANLINDGKPEDLLKNTIDSSVLNDIILFIRAQFEKKLIDNSQCIALFTILLDKSNEIVQKLMEFFLSQDSRIFAPLKFDLYRRLLKRSNKETVSTLQLQTISLFAWTNFKQGGMNLIAQVLIEKPELGINLFAFDNLKTITELCLNDIVNCEVFIQFVTFGYQIYKLFNISHPDFEIGIASLPFKIINKWSEDIQKGSDITMTAIILINIILKDSNRAVRAAFSAMNIQEQRNSIDQISKQITKIENKKKVQNLMVFSNARRRTQENDDEWQSLDDSDDDF
ncbi:hypothetical protein TRFO_13162 [Tritrichomonas foetus]|uniref:Uncharacterized protein n=1 Tax=Tritrichomonas foetus TaxID=1144522 RepID=A0A1J4L3L5_9EUKA|nr:hypothetical protein TRFO_13162 [Tritrichomonas foetus]|eukprot:OHT16564.1 hypothetical protein TRFO_13162 [Tritrichomonas foetus]